MWNKLTAAAAISALALAALTGCSSSDSSSGEKLYSVTPTTVPVTEASTGKYDGIETAAEGPVLSINDTTASPGGIAEVTLSVSNADRNWQMCGVHITYPNVLKAVLSNEEEHFAECTLGEASEGVTAYISQEWYMNFDPELEDNHLGAIFFTAMFDGDRGGDGAIATFYLQIPENAKPGAEYEIGFYLPDSDMFVNSAEDLSLEKYAFENAKSGKITIV